jgi:hypothetical protein
MLDFLNHLSTSISSFSASELAGSLAVAAEVALRVVPTQKPLSILYVVENALTAAANVINAANTALNKIIPQNTKTS